MPRYNTHEEVVQTFEPPAENYDLTYHAHRRDIRPLVNFANLVSGENVLDLGTGSGLGCRGGKVAGWTRHMFRHRPMQASSKPYWWCLSSPRKNDENHYYQYGSNL